MHRHLNKILYNFGCDYKSGYGWFVYVPDKLELEEIQDTCPDDLYACLVFARENDCNWIMFDSDVEPIDELAVYER